MPANDRVIANQRDRGGNDPNGGGHLIFVIDKPIAALLDGLPVENRAHHESERQRLTGRRSLIFKAKGIAGFVPGAVLLAASPARAEAPDAGARPNLNLPNAFPTIVAIMRGA